MPLLGRTCDGCGDKRSEDLDGAGWQLIVRQESGRMGRIEDCYYWICEKPECEAAVKLKRGTL